MSDAILWTATEAARATGGETPAEWDCTSIASDSRKVEPGALFVALKGPNHDAHDYVVQAFERGAAAALVARRPEGVAAGAPLLVVDDVLAALGRLAQAARARTAARVIAVTGSVGKTGTKETLRLALSEQGATFVSPASYNNAWGVPLSLAALPRDAMYAVFEIGMNHPGEIAPLARLVRPDVGVVTVIEAVHLAFFDSLAAIADAKAELFEGMDADGVAVLNHDDRFYKRLAAAARARGMRRILAFGRDPGAEVRLVEATSDAESSAVTAAVEGETIRYTVGAPGRHWVDTSLAALAAVRGVGADVGRAAARLAEARPLPGRGARHRVSLDGDAFTLIDESYNANPASMRAAIANLGATPPGPGGRRIAVLGDMLELGGAAPALHAALADPLAEADVDLVFTAGTHMARLRRALPAARRAGHAERSTDLIGPVVAALRAGDVVMVKGSLGSRMAPVVEALRARNAARRPRAAGNG
ncbi:MAG: UDP-N-acetylmuramoylalanyl-D-glutamyl-2,6-diaminopimelate--D-alanyl-D-alanine ligase [Alphaproteobacteria bacterium]